MANGAASAVGGIREEIDNCQMRLERSLRVNGLVTREEFDALLTRHEALASRLALLESTKKDKTKAVKIGNSPDKKAKTFRKTKKS